MKGGQYYHFFFFFLNYDVGFCSYGADLAKQLVASLHNVLSSCGSVKISFSRRTPKKVIYDLPIRLHRSMLCLWKGAVTFILIRNQSFDFILVTCLRPAICLLFCEISDLRFLRNKLYILHFNNFSWELILFMHAYWLSDLCLTSAACYIVTTIYACMSMAV